MTDVAPPVSPAPDEPPPGPTRRRAPRGFVWLSGVAVIVLAAVTILAFTTRRSGDHVQDIDPHSPSQLQGRDVTGDSVPDVALPRFDHGEMTGVSGSLADYRGRPLVVNFFASNCAPCVSEMPDFEQVHARIGDQVAFVGVDTLEQPGTGSQIVKQTGVGYDILFDQSGQIATDIDLLNMPTTLFVDAGGTIRKVHTGRLSQDDLEQIIHDTL